MNLQPVNKASSPRTASAAALSTKLLFCTETSPAVTGLVPLPPVAHSTTISLASFSEMYWLNEFSNTIPSALKPEAVTTAVAFQYEPSVVPEPGFFFVRYPFSLFASRSSASYLQSEPIL